MPPRGMLRLKNRRRRRGARQIRSKQTVLKGFTALQSKTIMRAIHRSDETKYYARDILVNYRLDPAIHTPATGASTLGDQVSLVPPIPLGTGESARIGRTVKPVKCRVDVSIGFPQINPGGTPTADQSWANQVYVVMYILSSKKYKNWVDYGASSQWKSLLDNGDSTTSSFGYQPPGMSVWASDTRDLMKPVETTEFTLLRKKVVKLTKNTGTIDNGPLPNVPNLASTCYRGSFSYKLPELKFDDTNEAAAGFPTNSNVFLAIGYCYADNNATYNLAGGDIVQVAPIVCATARAHVWYKDS